MNYAVKVFGGLVLVVLIGLMILMNRLENLFGEHYDTKDLIENYEVKSNEINAVKEYIHEITPEKFSVYVEFNSDKEVDIKVWEKSENGRTFWFQEWRINPYNYEQKERSEYELKYGGKTNSLSEITEKLNWSDHEFKELKTKLDKANCISIEKVEDTYTIGFQRSGMGKYHYKIFECWSYNDVKEKFNDGCIYKYFKENVALEYGGGAIGMQCFEDFYDKKNVKNAIAKKD